MTKGYFTEADGSKSTTRLNTNLMTWVGLLVLMLTVASPLIGAEVDTGTNLTIGFGLVGGGVTGKIVSKPLEKK